MVNAKSFLVAFRYSHKVAYVLEFSSYLLRIYEKKTALGGNGTTATPTSSTVTSETITLTGGYASSSAATVSSDMIAADWALIDDGEDIYSIETPYSYNDIWDGEELCFKLQTIQHSDVLYIFSERHPIMVLKRYGRLNWQLEALELKNGPFLSMNDGQTTITASGVTGNITLSSSAALFSLNDEGRLIRLRGYATNDKVWAAGITITSGDICVSDNKYYAAQNGGTTGTGKPVHTEGIRSDGGVRWRYLHAGYGVVKITTYQNNQSVTATVLSRLPEAVTDGTVYWEMGLIRGGQKYPKSGAFFRNRFAFLINTAEGPKVCLSMSGDYNNFADIDEGETTAECAITVPVINTEFNEGKWLFAGNVLFVGTGAAEFYIDVISTASALSNDNVKIAQISNVGSKALMPVAVGAHIFFADRYGLSLRDLAYNYYNDGYDQTDIAILGKHLFCSRIVAMSYQEVPNKILWCLTGDGAVTALTFSAEQEVVALSRHDFSGAAESLAIVPNFEKCTDEVWFEIKRMINGEVKRTVEYMENGMPLFFPSSIYVSDKTVDKEKDENDYVLKQAMYLDGAVLFVRESGDERTELQGLYHLEGETVAVFADGAVLRPQLVLNGKIAIDKNAGRVLVGKEVISQYVPQAIYLDNEYGSGIGAEQRINHVILMLYLSGGGQIGEDENTLEDIYYRNADGIMGRPEALFSGNKEVRFNGSTDGRNQPARILIENRSALPMNILAIVPVMD